MKIGYIYYYVLRAKEFRTKRPAARTNNRKTTVNSEKPSDDGAPVKKNSAFFKFSK